MLENDESIRLASLFPFHGGIHQTHQYPYTSFPVESSYRLLGRYPWDKPYASEDVYRVNNSSGMILGTPWAPLQPLNA